MKEQWLFMGVQPDPEMEVLVARGLVKVYDSPDYYYIKTWDSKGEFDGSEVIQAKELEKRAASAAERGHTLTYEPAREEEYLEWIASRF